MALGNVFISDVDGNIPYQAPSDQQKVTGLLFDTSLQPDLFTAGYGKTNENKVKLNDVLYVTSRKSAINDFGIIDRVDVIDPDQENVESFLHGIPAYHIREFFRMSGNIDGPGKLYVMFADCSTDWDAIDTMQRIAGGTINQLGVWTEQPLWKLNGGAIAKANVHESVAWVRQFNLFDNDFHGIELGFGDTNLNADDEFTSVNNYESLSPVLLDELDDKGYIFPIKYAGRENGIYISRDQTCSHGDFRTIARNRTINKSRRQVRAALLPYVNSPLMVNLSTGMLAASKITAFKTLIGDILAKMQAAQEISGYAVTIDPNQNVLVNDTLRISYVIVPVGVATRIYVEEGLSLTAK